MIYTLTHTHTRMNDWENHLVSFSAMLLSEASIFMDPMGSFPLGYILWIHSFLFHIRYIIAVSHFCFRLFSATSHFSSKTSSSSYVFRKLQSHPKVKPLTFPECFPFLKQRLNLNRSSTSAASSLSLWALWVKKESPATGWQGC